MGRQPALMLWLGARAALLLHEMARRQAHKPDAPWGAGAWPTLPAACRLPPARKANRPSCAAREAELKMAAALLAWGSQPRPIPSPVLHQAQKASTTLRK